MDQVMRDIHGEAGGPLNQRFSRNHFPEKGAPDDAQGCMNFLMTSLVIEDHNLSQNFGNTCSGSKLIVKPNKPIKHWSNIFALYYSWLH